MTEENTEKVSDEQPVAAPAPTSLEEIMPKMKLEGVVERLELYGAFIDVGVDAKALIHISQLGQERVNRVSDVLSVGDKVSVWVDKVDPERNQLMVTMIEPLDVEWRDLKPGQVYTGKIRRLENFGAFVDIGAEREGLVHISELSHEYVKHPGEVVAVGNEVQVKVLGFSRRKRRIDLSIKALMDQPEIEEPEAPQVQNGKRRRKPRERQRKEETVIFDLDDEEDEMPTAMEIALRKAMGNDLPTGARSSRRQKRRSRSRSQQEEILDRTLHMQDDN